MRNSSAWKPLQPLEGDLGVLRALSTSSAVGHQRKQDMFLGSLPLNPRKIFDVQESQIAFLSGWCPSGPRFGAIPRDRFTPRDDPFSLQAHLVPTLPSFIRATSYGRKGMMG